MSIMTIKTDKIFPPLWTFFTAPLTWKPQSSHTQCGLWKKIIARIMVYIKERSTNGYFLFWETSVMKLFSDRPLICVAFNCFPKCYRGWNLETIQTSKYLIGVMWCLSNMWTMLFVKNYWKRRRSRRRISYCGSVLTTLSFFHMLALRSPVSKCKFIFKTNWEDTKHSRIQCLTPVFFPFSLHLMLCEIRSSGNGEIVWSLYFRAQKPVFACNKRSLHGFLSIDMPSVLLDFW